MASLPSGPDEATRQIVSRVNRFALEFYQHQSETPGNQFASPLSIALALAMTSAGASGKTAEEIRSVLHLNLPDDRIHLGFQALNKALLSAEGNLGTQFSVANRLWGDQSYQFLPEFLAITREQYGAELATVDFETEAEAARQKINQWIAQQTKGKIEDFFPQGALNDFTRLVLTNAIYFKGTWGDPFVEAQTREQPFHLADGGVVQTPFMYQRNFYLYAEPDGLQVVRLPYQARHQAMIILLPTQAADLSKIEASLNLEQLHTWMASLKSQEVDLTLPRFRIETGIKLNQVLETLGVRLAFSPTEADFSRISGSPDLYLSEALHKAFVEVNEEGTEAAAATGMDFALSAAAPSRPKVFRADHPFLFLIQDGQTGSILFIGRLANPNS